ncbi:MAG: hypothetical protein JXN60_07900 [Lentisphaerae bacterium]|nr:hypothetical protein [Lentisphaerota bacterium]
MKLFSKEATGYAVLLVILFAIATIAVWETISYLEQLLPNKQFRIITVIVWSITLGFMFIAGAFGLWAIQFSAAAESRRRIGRLVDTMHYISDGILAIDHRGRITGSNPAASKMLGVEIVGNERMTSLFPALKPENLALLLDRKTPNEIEYDLKRPNDATIIRLRSQPSEDLILILMCDVTSLNAQRSRARQIARLELIAQLARAVANDFSNLLTIISGHVAILSHTQPESMESSNSISSITRCVKQGAALAENILDLVRPAEASTHSNIISEHIENAANFLRDSLPLGWIVHTNLSNEIPPVSLPGTQIEQLTLNLGHLVADACDKTGTLTLTLALPSNDIPSLNVDTDYAGVLLISADDNDALAGVTDTTAASKDSGVIQSVISSVLEEAGGKLDILVTRNGIPVYRVKLPPAKNIIFEHEGISMPQELLAYIGNWQFLVAMSKHRTSSSFLARLNELGIKHNYVENIASALARIEEMKKLDVMFLDKQLLGQESSGLLRAILKLKPSTGIVVLCENPEQELREFAKDVVLVQRNSSPDALLSRAIESKTLLAARHQQNAGNIRR